MRLRAQYRQLTAKSLREPVSFYIIKPQCEIPLELCGKMTELSICQAARRGAVK
jgi:hypothetical protein